MEGLMMMRRIKVGSVLLLMIMLILSACGGKSTEPDIQGTVTSMEGNRLLIVDKESLTVDRTTPTAIWVKFKEKQLKGVKIGYVVKAWSNGIMLESYPMQTDGIKLEVVNTNVGTGDLQGKVTNVYLDDANESKSYIEVDGKRLSLIPSTDYLLNDAPTNKKQIKVGDQVEIWLPGYQIMDEIVVTQVRLVR
jgi:hypothetical protein